jgi:hypothetical protein
LLVEDPKSFSRRDLASGSTNCGCGARKSVLSRCLAGVLVLFGVIATLRYEDELASALARLLGS